MRSIQRCDFNLLENTVFLRIQTFLRIWSSWRSNFRFVHSEVPVYIQFQFCSKWNVIGFPFIHSEIVQLFFCSGWSFLEDSTSCLLVKFYQRFKFLFIRNEFPLTFHLFRVKFSLRFNFSFSEWHLRYFAFAQNNIFLKVQLHFCLRWSPTDFLLAKSEIFKKIQVTFCS